MLYKYAKWDKYTQENLRNAQLRFNTPEQFNDPFDSYPQFVDDDDEKEAFFAINEKQGVPENVMKEIPNEVLLSLQRMADRNPIHNSKHGITCFTKKNDNILMWSHYADSHKGICIGFEWDEKDSVVDFLDGERNRHNSSFLEKGKCFPIAYCSANERPIFPFYLPKQIGETMIRKFDMWKYEEEVRFRVISARESVFPTQLYYKLERLKEIILGANMPLQHFSQCYRLVESLPNSDRIQIFVGMLSDHEYKVKIREVSCVECLRIINNYNALCKSSSLLSHRIILQFSKKLNCRKRKHREKKVIMYWKKALKSLPLDIVMMIRGLWDNSDIALLLNQGGTYVPRDLPPTIKYGFSIFMNQMRDRIEYLYMMDQRDS